MSASDGDEEISDGDEAHRPTQRESAETAAGASTPERVPSPTSTTAADATLVSPARRADSAPPREPRPAATRVDQFVLAQDLRPVRNVQSEYMTFDDYRYVNYHSEVYEGSEDADNTLSWVMLLKVGLPDTTRTYTLDHNKRQKLEPDKRKYKRNYTFANLLSNGNVMVFLEMSGDDQQKHMHYFDKFRIGDMFVIVEPDPSTSFISNSMPIVKTDYQIIPVALPPTRLLPRVEVPDVMGLNTSKYFIIHNAIIQFTGVNIVKSYCTEGNMCDYRLPHLKSCACWRQHNRRFIDADYVLKLHVRVKYVDTMGQTKTLPRTTNWSSRHFTDMVFDHRMPMDPLSQNQDQVIMTAIRRKMAELARYVNVDAPRARRGWTVVGWYRRGMTSDSAETAQADDKVAAAVENTTMHIVRIKPAYLTLDELAEEKKLLPSSYLGDRAKADEIQLENEAAAQL